MKETDKAIECMDKMIAIEPTNLEYYYVKFGLLESLEKYKEALECMEIVLKMKPNDLEATFNKASMLLKEKRYEEAIQNYTNFIDIEPNFPKAYLMRAESFVKIGDTNNAMKDFEMVLSLISKEKEKNFNSYSMLTHSCFQLKKYEDAKKYHLACLREYPDQQDLYVNIAELDFLLNDYDDLFAISKNKTDKLDENSKAIIEILNELALIAIDKVDNFTPVLQNSEKYDLSFYGFQEVYNHIQSLAISQSKKDKMRTFLKKMEADTKLIISSKK